MTLEKDTRQNNGNECQGYYLILDIFRSLGTFTERLKYINDTTKTQYNTLDYIDYYAIIGK